MSNALYYTFSTIAQTFAAAMAFLAAFLFFRLQSLNASMDRDASMIWGVLHDYHGRANDLLYERRYAELVEAAKAGYIPSGKGAPIHECARLTQLLTLKTKILNRFRLALALTVGVITYSVLVLIATPVISGSAVATALVVAGGLLGFAASMASYVRVLSASIDA